MGQTYTMQDGTFTTCSGTFYDSGGAGANYANNENFTITFCPSTSGDAIQLDFTSFNLEGNSSDLMVIYNGDNTGEPMIGSYSGNPGIVQGNNLTGCLTISFTSDNSVRRAGWQAAISCVTPCQTITAQLDTISITPNADNIIELCEGESVSVTGSGTFSDNGAGATYEWDFGDGSPVVIGTSASHTYTTAGVYIINLTITDGSPEACANSNYLGLIAHVYGEPLFNTISSSSVCLGSDTTINAGVTDQTFAINCAPPVVETTFLPDGDGAVYSTCIDVTCYDAGAVVTSINDIIDICLNIEHSYFGDLDIVIIAPNGQQATLVDNNLITNNSVHLGEALDNSDTNVDLTLGPGVGYDYCFSMSGAITLTNAPEVNFNSLQPGTYLPDESFASLIGAPLNGQWCIQVEDNLLYDNGYIFNWGINFSDAFAPPNLTYTQTVVSESWQTDPTIVSSSGGNLVVNPATAGNICYTYEVVDNAGCSHSKQYCVDAVACANTIDFDGINDYINTTAFLGGNNQITMMTWLKMAPGFDSGEVMGQRNFRLYIDANKRLKAYIRTNVGPTNNITTPDAVAPVLIPDIWYHVTAVYDGINDTLELYLNGELVWQGGGLTGNSIINNGIWNTSHDFEIGRNTQFDNDYFEGAIYETRVYKVALTEDQIKAQVYQEIENNGGNVRGSSIPKDIPGLNWDDLILYYKMDVVIAGATPDTSLMARDGTINNIQTAQEQTAPVPYIADTSGDWTDVNTWRYGTIWDITNLPNKDWAIVQITDTAKVTTTNSHTHLGLLIDSGAELEIQNDQLLENTSYLRLDGQLDLVGESQLIQTMNSELEITSSGYLERDQQGKADIYSYNYWSSPVNPVNNTANNTNYTIAQILWDGTDYANPQPITFNTTGYDGATSTPITLADYWMFKYVNQPDNYDNWFSGHIRSTGSLLVGEGYTQKGTGTTAPEQNYVFVGKPNNGTIQLPIDGDNVYLIGNPYPSAIDADQFIMDNISTIEVNGDVIGSGTSTGALYFWEHWGGASHALADYQGGFATYNLAGATLAIPDPDVSDIGTGSVLPQRYIPVGQGFFVQGDADGGTITFNNGQRVFERESDGNSVFISTNTSSLRPQQPTQGIQRIYFRFTIPEGMQRQLLLALKEGMTEDVDYGYDAALIERQVTDCAWDINERSYVIQTIGEVYDDLELPLKIIVQNDGVYKFSIDEISELPEGVSIYFVDKLFNSEVQLAFNEEHSFELTAGDYTERFYIKFDINDRLATVHDIIEQIVAYYVLQSNSIIIESQVDITITDIQLLNLLGQVVYTYDLKFNEIKKAELPVNINPGIYLLKFKHNNNKDVTRKVILK